MMRVHKCTCLVTDDVKGLCEATGGVGCDDASGQSVGAAGDKFAAAG